ncbi:hypothetical protein V8D89_006904 [Ganoderma adspersum]
MGGPESTSRRTVVRASKDQRRLLFLAYEADKTPSKLRLDSLSDQTGLSPDWIFRWFARQRRSDKKQAAQGCVDLTVKRELLDVNLAPAPAVPQAAPIIYPHGTRKPARRRLKKFVKKEETPEAPPLPVSSPSLRWSSPMLPSSSPPRTPTHIATPGQAWVYGDALSSPPYLHTRAYTSYGDSFVDPGSFDGEFTKSAFVKDEDAQEAFWLSSFTCRTLPGDFSSSGNIQRARLMDQEPVSAVSETAGAPRLTYSRTSGSVISAVPLDYSDDAIDAPLTAHGASSISRGNVSYHSSVDGDRSVANPSAHSAADDELELMMEELLAVLEAETDVVKIAVLLSQLHRLGLRW